MELRSCPAFAASGARRRLLRASAAVLVAACGLVTGPAVPARAADKEKPALSPVAIQRAIERARDWLIREQQANGSWECGMRTEETRVGATALVLLALANAGVDRSHLAMQRGLEWLRRQKPDETYSVALQTLALQKRGFGRRYDALVALGCVIRGETYHFEVVANESARGVLDVQLETGVPVANGDRKSTRLNSSHVSESRMPSSA